MSSADPRWWRVPVLVAALAVAFGIHGLPASAQPTSAPAQPARYDAATAAEAEARERVLRGERLFAHRDFAAAIAEYERAYALVPGHPVQHHALFNIAKCYEKLFQYGRALDYYDRYLREGGAAAQRREEVERTIAFLKDNLATLRLTTDVPADVWVDDRRVGEAPGVVLLGGGRHSVAVRAPGYEPALFEVVLAAAQVQHRRVSLQRLSDVSGASPGWFWASTTAAGVALATGLVLGAIALDKSAELDARLEDPVEALAVVPEDDDEVADLALAADVAFGSAVLLSATSLVLFFVTDWEAAGPRELTPRREQARTRALPSAAPGTVGFVVRGAL